MSHRRPPHHRRRPPAGSRHLHRHHPPGSELARQGAAWACTKERPLTDQDRDRIRASMATPRDAVGDPDATPEALCASDEHQDVVANRHAYCVRHGIVYVLVDGEDKVTGTAPLLVTARSAVEYNKVRWDESITVYSYEFTNIKSVKLSLSSSCTACTGGGPPAWGGGGITLSANQKDETGHLSYETTVRGGGMRQRSRIAYQSQTESADALFPIISYGQWAGPSVACDGQVGGSPGCIATDNLARVTLSKSNSKYAASAVAYEWAQNNLSDNNAMGTAKKGRSRVTPTRPGERAGITTPARLPRSPS
ncbi:hypothetical protein GCM10020000_84310 [Streptomyces olivoverticillatus]